MLRMLILVKAKENVRKAVETHNPAEQQKWLSESLRYVIHHLHKKQFRLIGFRLFTKGARILDIEKLREIAGDYQHLRYAKGWYMQYNHSN